jgi:hypothetical protein
MTIDATGSTGQLLVTSPRAPTYSAFVRVAEDRLPIRASLQVPSVTMRGFFT